MKHLSLLAKMAFICNLFFIACLVLQSSQANAEGSMVSMVAILGLVTGMALLNPLSNIINGIVLLQKKPLLQYVPAWLALANLFCLLLQIVYLLHTLL